MLLQGNPRKAIGRYFSRHCRLEESSMIYSKHLKKKNFQPRVFYLARLSFGIKEGSFPDKQKLKECITAKLVLQEMLKGLL